MRSSAVRRDPALLISWKRALLAVTVGAIAAAIVAFFAPFAVVPVVGWIVATGVVLTWVWRIIWPQDPRGTERLAERESRSRTTDTAIIVAAVVSLAAVILSVVQASNGGGFGATAAVILSLIGATLSWLLVNTVYALKYARAYYIDEDGGIDFNQEEPPSYSDFAYVAFTVGMSYGPAEVSPTTNEVRRIVLAHGLISFLFGTGIVAVVINLIANLSGQ
jgi:uncharacterized membrane protein